eukprot:7895899-Ditylum_brightwellii.AAC.1
MSKAPLRVKKKVARKGTATNLTMGRVMVSLKVNLSVYLLETKMVLLTVSMTVSPLVLMMACLWAIELDHRLVLMMDLPLLMSDPQVHVKALEMVVLRVQ